MARPSDINKKTMQVTREQIEPCTIGMEITIDEQQVNQAYEKAYHEFGKFTNVPGFRPGKAPRAMLEKYVNVERLQERVAEVLASTSYSEALKQEEIQPDGDPEVDFGELIEGQPWTYKVKVPLAPNVTLGDLSAIEVERPVVEVTDEDVNSDVEQFRTEHARLEKVEDRPVEAGDVLIAETSIQLEGEEAPAELRRSLIRMGDNIPGFDEAVIGMNIDEQKSFTLTYPEDFNDEERAGKPAVFTVKVISINRHVLPELTDDWVKQVSPAQSLLELRMMIRENRERSSKETSDRITEARIVEKLVESSTIEFSSIMIEEGVDMEMHDLGHMLEERKMTYDDYLVAVKKSKEEHQEELEKQVAERLKATLALRRLAADEKVDVSQQELLQAMVQYATMHEMSEDDIKRFSREEKNINAIANIVVQGKLRDILFSKATVKEVPLTD